MTFLYLADVKEAKEWLRGKSKDTQALCHRDKYGRRVLTYRMWDGNKYPVNTLGMFIVYMMLAREPKTQIAGITMVGDFTGVSRKHIPSTIPELKAYNSMINGGLPVHFHHSHIVDPPFFFMMVFKLARPIFPKEFFDNQIMHKRSDGLDELHKSLDKAYKVNAFNVAFYLSRQPLALLNSENQT